MLVIIVAFFLSFFEKTEAIQQESTTRQLLIRRQSAILHDYASHLRAYLGIQYINIIYNSKQIKLLEE